MIYQKTITSTEFRKNIEKYIDEVENGPILITYRGKPSVVLISIQEHDELKKIKHIDEET
jgi:prevent-host-death family protein